MRVIVSSVLQSRYMGYRVYASLATLMKEINEGTVDVSTIEFLIIHMPDDVMLEFGIILSKLHAMGIEKIVYINSNPEPMILLTVGALACPVITDELYFDNENELNSLLSDLNFGSEIAETKVDSNIGIIKDFMQSFMRGDAKINTNAYKTLTQRAIDSIEGELIRKDELLVQAGDSAVDIFRRAGTLVDKMMAEHKILTERLESLQDKINDEQRNNMYNSGSVMFFQTYRYTESRKVLLVREMSYCKYLTSFLMGYLQYLRGTLNVPAKLVILVGRGDSIYRKYKDSETPFTMIVPETANRVDIYERSQIITNTPNKVIFNNLFRTKDEVFIILDKIRNEKPPIMGTHVNTLYAVSGFSDINIHKLNRSDCIFSHAGLKGAFGTIPTVGQYPLDANERSAVYAGVTEMKVLYEKLNNRIKLKV